MTAKRATPIPPPDPAAEAEANAYLAATRPGTPGWQEAQRAARGEWTAEDAAAWVPGPAERPAEDRRQTVCTRHRYDKKAGVVRAISRRYAHSPCNGTTHAKQLTWW